MALPTTNLLAYWEADSGAVYTDAGVTAATNGQTVEQWNLTGGTGGANLTQATSGSRPTFTTGITPSGKPALLFNGTSNWLAGAFACSQPTFVLTVWKAVTGNVTGAYIHDGASTNTMALFNDGVTNQWAIGAGGQGPVVTTDTTSFHWTEEWFDGSNSRIAKDGGSYSSTASPGPNTNAAGITLGSKGGGSGAQWGNAYIAAVYIYTADPGTNGSDLTNLRAYVNSKWFAVSATAYTVTSPTLTVGMSGAASGNYGVTPNANYTGTITITPPSGCTIWPSGGVLSWSASASEQFFYITPTTGPTATVTITNSGGLTGPTSLTYTVEQQIAVTDSNIFFSPYNWYSDGGGGQTTNNINGSSTYAITNNPGAYIKTGFTGTSVGFTADTTPPAGISLPSVNYPLLRVVVDGIETDELLVNGTTNYYVAQGLAAGSHTLEIYWEQAPISSATYNRWNTLTTACSAVKITGLLLDATTGATAAPTLKSRRAVFFGDSITEAAFALATSGNAMNDPAFSYARYMSDQLNCEYGLVGFAGQGLLVSGYGNVPNFYDTSAGHAASTWKFYASGLSRSFTNVPDYVFFNFGTNDGSGPFQSQYQGLMADLRSVLGSHPYIFPIVPPSGVNRSVIDAAATATGDSKLTVLDAGTTVQLRFPGSGSSDLSLDGKHPSWRGHGVLAADWGLQALNTVYLPAASNVKSGTSFGNGQTGTYAGTTAGSRRPH